MMKTGERKCAQICIQREKDAEISRQNNVPEKKTGVEKYGWAQRERYGRYETHILVTPQGRLWVLPRHLPCPTGTPSPTHRAKSGSASGNSDMTAEARIGRGCSRNPMADTRLT